MSLLSLFIRVKICGHKQKKAFTADEVYIYKQGVQIAYSIILLQDIIQLIIKCQYLYSSYMLSNLFVTEKFSEYQFVEK